MKELPDIQNTSPSERIKISRVGISNLKVPIRVQKKEVIDDKTKMHDYFSTVATVDLSVDLLSKARGLNMSRFAETLLDHIKKYNIICATTLLPLMDSLISAHNSSFAYVAFRFPYAIKKQAPVTNKEMEDVYNVGLIGIKNKKTFSLIIEVNVTAAAVCPCSKEMSLLRYHSDSHYIEMENMQRIVDKCGFGAHNQRSLITLRVVQGKEIVWIEDLISLVEKSASAPTFPLLKRPDEKFVTELGYNNPKFVEDIIRTLKKHLLKNKNVKGFEILVTNQESIHPYDVYAYDKYKFPAIL